MIRIGDFSKVSRISIKTLRYYDETELLKPIHVERESGYRFYSFSQLPKLHRILVLKDLGFSLEQIAQLLYEGVSEAVVYLKRPSPATEQFKVYELPAATMAYVVHKGPYNTFNQAYEAIGHWIETNGYTITGPIHEVYLYSTQPIRQDDDTYITEIQFPVAKDAPLS